MDPSHKWPRNPCQAVVSTAAMAIHGCKIWNTCSGLCTSLASCMTRRRPAGKKNIYCSAVRAYERLEDTFTTRTTCFTASKMVIVTISSNWWSSGTIRARPIIWRRQQFVSLRWEEHQKQRCLDCRLTVIWLIRTRPYLRWFNLLQRSMSVLCAVVLQPFQLWLYIVRSQHRGKGSSILDKYTKLKDFLRQFCKFHLLEKLSVSQFEQHIPSSCKYVIDFKIG